MGSQRSSHTISSKLIKHQQPASVVADKSDRPLSSLKSTPTNHNSNAVLGAPKPQLTTLVSGSALVDFQVNDINSSSFSRQSYAVGDKVDGNCTLPNGSKRWYPGVVTNVKYGADKRFQLVTIKFNDGEEREIQNPEDVRFPKRRKQRGEK